MLVCVKSPCMRRGAVLQHACAACPGQHSLPCCASTLLRCHQPVTPARRQVLRVLGTSCWLLSAALAAAVWLEPALTAPSPRPPLFLPPQVHHLPGQQHRHHRRSLPAGSWPGTTTWARTTSSTKAHHLPPRGQHPCCRAATRQQQQPSGSTTTQRVSCAHRCRRCRRCGCHRHRCCGSGVLCAQEEGRQCQAAAACVWRAACVRHGPATWRPATTTR